MTDDLRIKVKTLKATLKRSNTNYASDALDYINILEKQCSMPSVICCCPVCKSKDITDNSQYQNNVALGDVSHQRELLKSFCEYIGVDMQCSEEDMLIDIENHIKHFNNG